MKQRDEVLIYLKLKRQSELRRIEVEKKEVGKKNQRTSRRPGHQGKKRRRPPLVVKGGPGVWKKNLGDKGKTDRSDMNQGTGENTSHFSRKAREY